MPFQKGNTLWKTGKGGRKKKSKNVLPHIRDRVVDVLQKRLNADKALSDVSTDTLIKFLQSILPKDTHLKFSAEPIKYISNTPRPENTLTHQENIITADVVVSESGEEQIVNDIQSQEEIANDNPEGEVPINIYDNVSAANSIGNAIIDATNQEEDDDDPPHHPQ